MTPRRRRDWAAKRRNRDAGLCTNDDDRPVCPPSKVLCRECLGLIGDKMRVILARLGARAEEGKP